MVPTHVGGVGDLTFEVGFVITAVVYLTWHAIAGTGRENTLSRRDAGIALAARARFAACVSFHTAV